LHGYLANVAYEKPVEKFKGIIYRHMGDIEGYYGQLESMKDDIEAVTKNLDSVFNLLSRQLTLMLNPNEVPTIYEKDISIEKFGEENARITKKELSEQFDSLSDKSNSIVEPTQQIKKTLKSGIVGWD